MKGAPTASADWSGLYMGVSFGGGWGDSLFDANPSGVPLRATPDIDGLAGGAQIGANLQRGALVIGVEGRGLITGIQGDEPDQAIPVFQMRTEIDWVAASLGKIGIARGNWLAYGTGGYALAAHRTFTTVPGTGFTIGQRDVRHGYAWGGGLEAKRGNLVFGVDYLHIDIEDHIRPGFNSVGADPNGLRHRADADIDIITARVSYKLNRAEEATYKK